MFETYFGADTYLAIESQVAHRNACSSYTVVYFMALSVLNYIAFNVRMIDELERIWKEAAVA
jgi:hypothetical protein